jgi:hypothetical protein
MIEKGPDSLLAEFTEYVPLIAASAVFTTSLPVGEIYVGTV